MAVKVGTTATFTKGMAVKVTPREGFGRDHDLWRPLTEEEKEEWYASDASKGMTSAGETKLCPRHTCRVPGPDEVFKIVRARVKTTRGYHDVPGCAEVMDADGVHWFVRRSDLY
jgi:hypothetical protein